MRRYALGMLLAAALAACGPPPGVLFHTTLTSPDGAYELPVTLGDRTALVVAIEPAPDEPFPDADLAVRVDPADPRALILSWVNGACHNESVVAFWPDGEEYNLAVTSRGRLFASCPAIALSRAIRIRTTEPIPIGQINLAGPDE